MKKLGKKLNTQNETLQAFQGCICGCGYYCIGSVPYYAPQLSIIGGNRA